MVMSIVLPTRNGPEFGPDPETREGCRRFPRIIPEILVVVPSRADIVDDVIDGAKDGYQNVKDTVQGNETVPVPLPAPLPEPAGNDTDRPQPAGNDTDPPLLNFDNSNRNNGNTHSSIQS